MPKYIEHEDLGGTPMFDDDALGSRMMAERNVKGFKNADTVAELMRSKHRVSVSGRQYRDMENGAKPIPLAVFLAYVDVVNPPGGRAFAREAMSADARRVLGIE